MSKQTRERSRAHAAHLKEWGVERTSGACPWGCGASISNGGTHLLGHLNTCKGPGKKNGKNAKRRVR